MVDLVTNFSKYKVRTFTIFNKENILISPARREVVFEKKLAIVELEFKFSREIFLCRVSFPPYIPVDGMISCLPISELPERRKLSS